MRKLIGVLLLIAGTGGLAFWASVDHAVRVQDAIDQRARDIARASDAALTVRTSGRDVTVTGTVTRADDLAIVSADLAAIDGLRALDLSGVTLLPVADPFEITLRKDEDGRLTAQGVIPSEDARRDLVRRDAQAFADLPLAAGVPDAAWMQALSLGLDGLAALPSGTLTLSDRTLTLTGGVPRPTDKTAVVDLIQPLPDGYVLQDAIDVLDDGRPLRLDVRVSDGITRATGKLPADMALTEVSDRFPDAALALDQSRLAAGQVDWPPTATTALDALALLDTGRLQLEGTTLEISGRGTPDALTQAGDLLDSLPSSYTVTRSLDVTDDGAPLALTITYDGVSATASGKYPAGFRPTAPAGVPLDDTGQASFLTADDFAATARAGAKALALLQRGTLTVTEDSLTLEGEAASPQVGALVDDMFSPLTAEVTRTLSYIDDGSPAAWSMTYSAANGASVEGRLPTTLTLDDLSTTLGLPVTGSPGLAAEDDTPGAAPEALALIAGILPELESLTLTVENGGTALDLVTQAAVDIDQLATDLAQRLPASVGFSIQPVAALPEQGESRINAATGLAEVFLDGFWIPDLNFSTTLDGCTAESRAILADGRINFLSGSARLEATSIRTINALAAVAKPCVEADLELEVSGHTDASGDADQNQILSQDRAEAVRAALIARGVPARAITAIGFGADQPVADNDTPEGRTLNRRTEIDWFEKGALRDP